MRLLGEDRLAKLLKSQGFLDVEELTILVPHLSINKGGVI